MSDDRQPTIAERLTRIETILEERLPEPAISREEYKDHETRLKKLERQASLLWGAVAVLGALAGVAGTIVSIFVN